MDNNGALSMDLCLARKIPGGSVVLGNGCNALALMSAIGAVLAIIASTPAANYSE